jgi:hypothetical protein
MNKLALPAMYFHSVSTIKQSEKRSSMRTFKKLKISSTKEKDNPKNKTPPSE